MLSVRGAPAGTTPHLTSQSASIFYSQHLLGLLHCHYDLHQIPRFHVKKKPTHGRWLEECAQKASVGALWGVFTGFDAEIRSISYARTEKNVVSIIKKVSRLCRWSLSNAENYLWRSNTGRQNRSCFLYWQATDRPHLSAQSKATRAGACNNQHNIRMQKNGCL